MTPQESELITGLFQRLKTVNSGPKDSEAEQLIQKQAASQADSLYYLVQTVLVQEHALQNAQARIAELQRQIAAGPGAQAPQQQKGNFLSNLLHPGGAPAPARPAPAPAAASVPPPLPYPSTTTMAPSAGGGFLKGALATAAGVAGGSLLFQGIENLLGHNAGAFGPALGGYGGGFGPGGGFLGRETVENIENVENIRNVENVQNIENVENVQNDYGADAPTRDFSQDDSFQPVDQNDPSNDQGGGYDDPSSQDDSSSDSGDSGGGDSGGGGDWA